MPTTTTVNSNYSGEAAGLIFQEAFNETDSVQRGLITYYPDVRHELSLRKIQGADGTTDYACGFTPAGAISLSENKLTIKMLKHDFEVCKDDFRVTWNGEGDILEAIQVNKLGAQIDKWEDDMWNGATANDGEFRGIIPQLDADGDVIKANNGIVPLEAAITKDNVLAELEKVTAVFPVKIRKKKDFKVVVSSNVADAYEKYLIAQGLANGMGGEGSPLKYGKYTIEEVAELPDNTIVAYRASNLVVATYKSNDKNELTMVDTSETLLDGNVRGKIVYGADTGYHDGSEVVYYVSTTAVA
jgi:hypothetical protein